MKKIPEDELMAAINDAFYGLSPIEFVKVANSILSTDYTVDDIKWDDGDG